MALKWNAVTHLVLPIEKCFRVIFCYAEGRRFKSYPRYQSIPRKPNRVGSAFLYVSEAFITGSLFVDVHVQFGDNLHIGTEGPPGEYGD